MTADEVKAILESHRWTFAKTMPHNPHYWSVRKQWDPDQMFKCVEWIDSFGEDEVYYGRTYRVMHLGKWKYWTMGEGPSDTTLINRCLSPRWEEPEE